MLYSNSFESPLIDELKPQKKEFILNQLNSDGKDDTESKIHNKNLTDKIKN